MNELCGHGLRDNAGALVELELCQHSLVDFVVAVVFFFFFFSSLQLLLVSFYNNNKCRFYGIRIHS